MAPKPVDIRAFRSKVALLKRKGLLPSTKDNGFTLDARSAYPSSRVGNRTLKSIVNKFDDVISGKSVVLKPRPNSLTQFRKAKYRVVNGRVLVPVAATEKARIIKGGQIEISDNRTGVTRVVIPIEFHNLEQYLRDILANATAINKLKRKNEYFGLRFHGGQRGMFFSKIEFLIEYLQGYEAVLGADTRIKQIEVYRNLEILRFSRPAADRFEDETLLPHRRRASQAANRRRNKRFLENLANQPEKLAKYRAAQNARMKAYRSRMTKTQKKKYKRAAIKRRKLSDKRKK